MIRSTIIRIRRQRWKLSFRGDDESIVVLHASYGYMLKKLSLIRPRYIVAIAAGIALLMFISAVVELRQSREELLQVLRKQSVSLAETIERSSANVVLSSEYIEDQLAERLFNNAYYIAQLDSLQQLSNYKLQLIAEANNIFRINVFNKNGERIFTNVQPLGVGFGQMPSATHQSFIMPILRGETERVVIGFRKARFQAGERFAVAVRRTHRAGGAIVLNLDAAEILEFRKSIGIGRLITDLGNNSGIEYVVLQDGAGILAATKNVKEISRIEDDTLLAAVLHTDTVHTRQTMFRGREVFEVVRPLTIEESAVGVLRIGLSMDEIRAVENRMWRRMAVMTIALAVIGVIVLTAIVAMQNFHLMTQQYERTRVLTENILYHMQDIVVALDGEERITVFNQSAEKFFGVIATDVVGKKLQEIPEELKNILVRLYSAQPQEQEHIVKMNEGNEKIVSVSVSTSYKQDGTVESKTLLVKDRTEERLLEREIQQKEKLTAMGELASGVAHEIRNPLNAISMIAQRLEREFSPKKDARQYKLLTSALKQESLRVNSIVQQFLKFARPPKLRLTMVQSEEFLQHLSTIFEPLAAQKGVKFSSFAEPLTLPIDREQITQAALNLLQNALDATQRKGKITLEIRRHGNTVMITVQDTGEGIPKEIQKKIFNLYFTTKSKGNGLGLAITHQIVSQHGGTIEFESEEKKGTTFTIKLPLVR